MEEQAPIYLQLGCLHREAEGSAKEVGLRRYLLEELRAGLARAAWSGAGVSSRLLCALSTLSPWPRLKGLLMAVLSRTMISTELAGKRICVAFHSLVLPECGFQQYCCAAPAVSSTVKRGAHLSGIVTGGTCSLSAAAF